MFTLLSGYIKEGTENNFPIIFPSRYNDIDGNNLISNMLSLRFILNSYTCIVLELNTL